MDDRGKELNGQDWSAPLFHTHTHTHTHTLTHTPTTFLFEGAEKERMSPEGFSICHCQQAVSTNTDKATHTQTHTSSLFLSSSALSFPVLFNVLCWLQQWLSRFLPNTKNRLNNGEEEPHKCSTINISLDCTFGILTTMKRIRNIAKNSTSWVQAILRSMI